MITPAENLKLEFIKTLTMTGKGNTVSASDKQWVLDLVRREQIAVPTSAVAAANAIGFVTCGVVTVHG